MQIKVDEQGCTSFCSLCMSAAASEADRVSSSRLFTMLPSRSSDKRGVTCTSAQHRQLSLLDNVTHSYGERRSQRQEDHTQGVLSAWCGAVCASNNSGNRLL